MADLKDLLGDAFKEGMTNDEIVDAISTSEKIVNLSKGDYVAKGKFDDLSSKYSKTMEETKDYDDFKKQAEEYKTFKKNVTLKDTFKKSGIKDEFLDYAIFQVDKGKIVNDDKFNDNINEWLKANPQYANSVDNKQDDKSELNKNVPPEKTKEPEIKQRFPDKQPIKKPKVLIADAPKSESTGIKKSWNKFNSNKY